MAAAQEIYSALQAAGVEVILDDRDAKPGVKFKDWDLIGLPFKVVCGRGLAEGKVEIKGRQGFVEELPLAVVVEKIQSLLSE